MIVTTVPPAIGPVAGVTVATVAAGNRRSMSDCRTTSPDRYSSVLIEPPGRLSRVSEGRVPSSNFRVAQTSWVTTNCGHWSQEWRESQPW